MSTVRIPEGKKRYAVTLSIDTVEKYRALSKSLGMPITSMSALCEDAISQVTATMAQFAERHKTKGKLSMVDLVQVIGQQLEELEKEEKEHAEKQERAAAPDKKRA